MRLPPNTLSITQWRTCNFELRLEEARTNHTLMAQRHAQITTAAI
jgi:hypothetical protein